MDFTLTEEQELLRSTARTLLTKECPTSLVRAHMLDPSAAAPLWAHLREWVGLGEGPLVDLCLFLEEAGAVLAPGPFFTTAAVFVPLLLAVDHPLGGDAVAGRVSGTVAMAGSSGVWCVNDDPVRTFVLEADAVEHVAFVVPGPAVAVRPALGLVARQVQQLDSSRRAFDVDVPEVRTGALAIDQRALDAVVERATVALAAEMVGTARWLLDATVQYAKDRVQFDKPIGSFQAIQHKLVDMALAVERAGSVVAYAAMCIDAGDPERHRAAHVAKASAGEAARRCARDGIQIHGGIGYTWEHDLHLFMRRAYTSEHLLGTTAWHHDRLADLLLGPVRGT